MKYAELKAVVFAHCHGRREFHEPNVAWKWRVIWNIDPRHTDLLSPPRGVSVERVWVNKIETVTDVLEMPLSVVQFVLALRRAWDAWVSGEADGFVVPGEDANG